MLNFYTLIVDVESIGVKAEQKNTKLSSKTWLGGLRLNRQ